MPYGAVEKGLITAVGLPTGLVLKRPSAYGGKTCQQILQSAANFKLDGTYLMF
jgi:hypothetical protein